MIHHFKCALVWVSIGVTRYHNAKSASFPIITICFMLHHNNDSEFYLVSWFTFAHLNQSQTSYSVIFRQLLLPFEKENMPIPFNSIIVKIWNIQPFELLNTLLGQLVYKFSELPAASANDTINSSEPEQNKTMSFKMQECSVEVNGGNRLWVVLGGLITCIGNEWACIAT